MTLKQYIIFMAFGTLLCFLTWTMIVFNINPQNAGLVIFLFFYATLFLWVLGASSIVGFLVRYKFIKVDEVIFRSVKRTLRQSLFISLLVTLIALLLQLKLLAWWNTAILFILFLVIEGLIFSNRKFNNIDYV
jgi:hypothetical protein